MFCKEREGGEEIYKYCLMQKKEAERERGREIRKKASRAENSSDDDNDG